jgi:hypothetical protein
MLLATSFGCGELVWLAPLVFAAGVGTWHEPPQGPTMPANPRAMRSRAARNVFAAAGVHGSEAYSPAACLTGVKSHECHLVAIGCRQA